MILPSRRSFIKNLVAFTAAAPAIVRASSLMPVSSAKLVSPFSWSQYQADVRHPQFEIWNGYRWWVTEQDHIVHYERWPQ